MQSITIEVGLPDDRKKSAKCDVGVSTGVRGETIITLLAFLFLFVALGCFVLGRMAPSPLWTVGQLLFGGLGGAFILVRILSGRGNKGFSAQMGGGGFDAAKWGQWGPYVKVLASASLDLYAFLQELSGNTRCRDILDGLSGMPSDLAPEHFSIDHRLGFIVYCDVRDCFRELGHSTSHLSNIEGMGYAMFMALLICRDFDIDNFYDPNQSAKMVQIAEQLATTVTAELDIKGYEDEFRFPVIFGLANHETEWVQRFATLLYRWASLIAKADGTVTERESSLLAAIQKMKDCRSSGNVRLTERGEISEACQPRTDNSVAPESPFPGDGGRLREAMGELDDLIGLLPVKDEVRKLTSFIRIQQKRSLAGLKVAPISYHCVFTGNPGTGKTTVARILAEIYHGMGILKKGHLVETDRSGLVAEYVGQTAVKTNRVIDSAMDGVLFIDEAYSLVGTGGQDYGSEAIATLLKRMEDDRDRLVVILAGYSEEMKSFIDSNPGLQSRFNRYIRFPDYSAEELTKIFLRRAEKSQYRCDDDVRQSIAQIMERAVASKDENFGNGRYARNLFEKAIERQAVRLSTVAPLTKEMLATLTLEDLDGSGRTHETA